MSLDLMITLAVVFGGVGAYVLISRHASRPADPMRPRMLPWRPIMILVGFLVLVAVIHLVNLMGVETGRDVGGAPFR
jgi:amino acid transporter